MTAEPRKETSKHTAGMLMTNFSNRKGSKVECITVYYSKCLDDLNNPTTECRPFRAA